jgi:tetratricopeptide (TPR) repeat protein
LQIAHAGDHINHPSQGIVGGVGAPERDRNRADELVRDFLRGQNLEQLGRTDEAIDLYERAVAASFDAAGPYDRLIWIYQNRKAHRDVIRVAQASIRNVRTYPAKTHWYEEQVAAAQAAQGSPPQPRPR